MIPFDPAKLTVEIVRLKSVSTALGGSAIIVDEVRSTPKKEVTTRIELPTVVARDFKKANKETRYLKPMIAALTRYEERVVAIETHPYGGFGKIEEELPDGTKRRWKPQSQFNVLYELPAILQRRSKWLYDGRYAYAFADDMTEEQAVRNGLYLNEEGSFRKVVVDVIDLHSLHTVAKFETVAFTQRTCLAFVANNGTYAVSPPIWKDVSDVGASGLKLEKTEEGSDIAKFNIGNIDKTMHVNLNFALVAGRAIGSVFGFEAVEPLQLPRLMIELHTVNLPGVSKHVKSTYDIGMTFSHAMAWLLGLQRRANTVDSYLTVRALIKYLTQRGLFRSSKFEVKNVLQEGMTVKDVPKLDLANLRQKDQISVSDMLQRARELAKTHRAEYIANLVRDE